MSEHEAIEVARRGVEAFNAADWDAAAAGLAADSVYEEPATGRRVTGVEAILEANKGWKSAFPDARGTITSQLASGGTAVLEITWEGTQTGALMGAAGTIPATGRRATIKAVQVVDVENGRATSTRHYFDMAGMLAQLGVGAPSTG